MSLPIIVAGAIAATLAGVLLEHALRPEAARRRARYHAHRRAAAAAARARRGLAR